MPGIGPMREWQSFSGAARNLGDSLHAVCINGRVALTLDRAAALGYLPLSVYALSTARPRLALRVSPSLRPARMGEKRGEALGRSPRPLAAAMMRMFLPAREAMILPGWATRRTA